MQAFPGLTGTITNTATALQMAGVQAAALGDANILGSSVNGLDAQGGGVVGGQDPGPTGTNSSVGGSGLGPDNYPSTPTLNDSEGAALPGADPDAPQGTGVCPVCACKPCKKHGEPPWGMLYGTSDLSHSGDHGGGTTSLTSYAVVASNASTQAGVIALRGGFYGIVYLAADNTLHQVQYTPDAQGNFIDTVLAAFMFPPDFDTQFLSIMTLDKNNAYVMTNDQYNHVVLFYVSLYAAEPLTITLSATYGLLVEPQKLSASVSIALLDQNDVPVGELVSVEAAQTLYLLGTSNTVESSSPINGGLVGGPFYSYVFDLLGNRIAKSGLDYNGIPTFNQCAGPFQAYIGLVAPQGGGGLIPAPESSNVVTYCVGPFGAWDQQIEYDDFGNVYMSVPPDNGLGDMTAGLLYSAVTNRFVPIPRQTVGFNYSPSQAPNPVPVGPANVVLAWDPVSQQTATGWPLSGGSTASTLYTTYIPYMVVGKYVLCLYNQQSGTQQQSGTSAGG